MNSAPTIASALSPEYRERLIQIADEASFETGTRLFEEGRRADRFWIVRTGVVALDLHVPGRRAAVIESLGHGELIGWSWHFAPYVWQLGAEALHPVQAWEYDAVAVRAMSADDPEFGRAIAVWVGRVIAHRAEPGRHRGRPGPCRTDGDRRARRGRRGVDAPVRAGHPQPRSVHLLRHPLPRPDRRTHLNPRRKVRTP